MTNDEIFALLNDMPQDEFWILNIDPVEFGRRIAKRQQEIDCERIADYISSKGMASAILAQED